MAVDGPVRLPNGQLHGVPGSNGGVHRGPDRYPRVTQAQFMRALLQSQARKVKGANGKTETVVVEMAMHKDLIAMMQLIARNAARGRGLKYGLKLLEIEEKVFRVPPGQNGLEPQAPIVARFIRGPEHPVSDEPSAAEPTTGIQANGREYVE